MRPHRHVALLTSSPHICDSSMSYGSAITLRELEGLTRRLAVSLEAGLDLRRVLAREARGRARRSLVERFEQLRLEVNRGRSLSDSLERTGEFFPPLFREM